MTTRVVEATTSTPAAEPRRPGRRRLRRLGQSPTSSAILLALQSGTLSQPTDLERRLPNPLPGVAALRVGMAPAPPSYPVLLAAGSAACYKRRGGLACQFVVACAIGNKLRE